LEKKSIGKKKPYVSDDEWENLGKGVGEKMEDGDILDVQDRSITFNDEKNVTTKEEDYKLELSKFKDRFADTKQYLKFMNAHLAEKNDHLNKVIADSDRFYEDIVTLNTEKITKDQIDKKNYTQLKVEDVRKVLEYVQEERDAIKDKIEHFSTKINLAKNELENKNEEVEKIKLELTSIKSSENPNQTRDGQVNDTTESIQKELKNLGSINESDKIFGAINSLIVLLNSKNDSTLNELKSVKSEFSKMKQDYDKVMNVLEKNKVKK